MHVLYMATNGPSDATRASIPLHLTVNGSLEAGQTVSVVLAGDATELLKGSTCDAIEGLGVPPMRELIDKARQHELPIYA
jgi:predicted peroxiredoxin